MFKKVLIANRGEIAVRVMRALRELGIRTVAVYSEADREALHVQLADEAVEIGPAPSSESYLNMQKLLEVAREVGAQAIHPGYGFLSENHQFAKACEDAGVVFIGPPSHALKLVGDKIASRETMKKAGLPLIPGQEGTGSEARQFLDWAERTGYPVVVKAAAGGGGKGMRTVHRSEELESALESASREAKSAFGDDTVYLEKYLVEPRHVEFQILRDCHGNAVHLFERECSIQRRHQKIIEETPSVALDGRTRGEMGAAAIKVAEASGYVNAGTVEFLLDKSGRFYFLEVNARIQVEHPITEAVVGVDLVREQVRIAQGERLRFTQKDLSQRGHAIECRIYAEDPATRFAPSPGRVLFVNEPAGPGIRVDSGLFSGWDVPIHYDPILSKLIVWAEGREAARKKMICALDDYAVLGIKTPIYFLREVMAHPKFIVGETYTDFIDRHFPDWSEELPAGDLRDFLVAGAIDSFHRSRERVAPTGGRARASTPWEMLGSWRLGQASGP